MHSLQCKCICELFSHPLGLNLCLWCSGKPTLSMCFAKQQSRSTRKQGGWVAAKGSKLHRSLLRKGEGVQLVAHCAQPARWFPGSPTFKGWRVSSLRPKHGFSLSKPRKQHFHPYTGILGEIQPNLTEFVAHTGSDQEETNKNSKCLFATDVQWYLYWVQCLQNWVTAFYLKKKSAWFQLIVLPVWYHLFVDNWEIFVYQYQIKQNYVMFCQSTKSRQIEKEIKKGEDMTSVSSNDLNIKA